VLLILQINSNDITLHKLILTLILLMWRLWWASNNARKWQMGFNLAFKGLKSFTWNS